MAFLFAVIIFWTIISGATCIYMWDEISNSNKKKKVTAKFVVLFFPWSLFFVLVPWLMSGLLEDRK